MVFSFLHDLDVMTSPASGSDLHKYKKWLQKVKVQDLGFSERVANVTQDVC